MTSSTPVRQWARASRHEPGPRQHVAQVAGRDVAAAVALAARGEHGVGTHLETATDAAGEVDPEERVARVGDGVDHAAHQVLLGLADTEVLTAERHDHRSPLAVDHRGDPVGLEPGGHHDVVEVERRGVALHADHDAVATAPDVDHARTEAHLPAGGGHLGGQGPGDRGVVGDGRARRVEGRQPDGVRLDLADLLRREPAQPRHPVVGGGPLEGVEAPHLVGVDGHDELAALDVGDRVLGAEVTQQAATAGAQLGLEAAGLVVDAGVHDAGVVTGLVRGEAVLLLEHHHLGARTPSYDLARDRDAEDAATDDADPCVPHGRTVLAPAGRVKPHSAPSHNGGMRDLHVPAGPGLPEGLVVPAADLVERFSRSPGPGGQSVNTSDSRVELELDLTATTALTDTQRSRALRRWPEGRIAIAASEHRSQHRNRVAARERLAEMLREALAPPPPPRRKTRPTRGSKERRLRAKKERAGTKALRGRVRDRDRTRSPYVPPRPSPWTGPWERAQKGRCSHWMRRDGSTSLREPFRPRVIWRGDLDRRLGLKRRSARSQRSPQPARRTTAGGRSAPAISAEAVEAGSAPRRRRSPGRA